MGFGFALPFADLRGGPLRRGSLVHNARQLEDAGFASLWAFDALGRGFLLPDPLQALSVSASATEHLVVGTGILQLPLRPVVDVASRALTIGAEIGDRFILGVGPGSTRADFELFDLDFDSRFNDFDREFDVLRELLTTGRSGDRVLSPRPPETPIALALAGWRGSMIERAARDALAWIASGFHAGDEELADGLGRFRQAGGERAIVTNVQVADLDEGAARAHRLHELGFDEVVVMDPTPSDERLSELARALGLGE